MTSVLCEHWRGLLALDAIGEPVEEERAALDDHLAHCAECRHERDALGRIGQVLPLADPDHLDEHELPAHLADAVLTRLGTDARRDRRRRRAWLGTGAAAGAAAAVAAVGLAVALASSPAPGTTLSLHGAPGVVASVRLTSESWGTAVHLVEHGQSSGQVLWVSMRTTNGGWWPAGTYTTVAGRAVEVDMACALPTGKIAGVWVRDGQGHTALQGYIDRA